MENHRQGARERRLERRWLTLAGNRANMSLPAAASTVDVTLTPAEFDVGYGVIVTPSWNTTVWVTAIAVNGFTINFGTATPDANQFVNVATFREV